MYTKAWFQYKLYTTTLLPAMHHSVWTPLVSPAHIDLSRIVAVLHFTVLNIKYAGKVYLTLQMDVTSYRASICMPAFQPCLFVVVLIFSHELTTAVLPNMKYAVTSCSFWKWDLRFRTQQNWCIQQKNDTFSWSHHKLVSSSPVKHNLVFTCISALLTSVGLSACACLRHDNANSAAAFTMLGSRPLEALSAREAASAGVRWPSHVSTRRVTAALPISMAWPATIYGEQISKYTWSSSDVINNYRHYSPPIFALPNEAEQFYIATKKWRCC